MISNPDGYSEKYAELARAIRELRQRVQELEAQGLELLEAARNAPLVPEHSERYIRALCKFQPTRAALSPKERTDART